MVTENVHIVEAPFLEDIIRMGELELFYFCADFLKKHGYKKIVITPFYIYAEGTIPVLLAVHADVAYYKKVSRIDRVDDGVYKSPEGIRGDDRCGVFAVVDILNDGYKPCVFITLGEENMGIGSMAAAMEMKAPRINCIVGIDRQGRDDVVFYQNENREFIDYMTSFGFVERKGRLADTEFIGTAWGIASANLSAGYMEEHHGDDERVHVNWLFEIIEKIKTLLENPPCKAFPYGNSRYKDTSIMYKHMFDDFDFRYSDWLNKMAMLTSAITRMDVTILIFDGNGNYSVHFLEKRIYSAKKFTFAFDDDTIKINVPGIETLTATPLASVQQGLTSKKKSELQMHVEHVVLSVTHSKKIFARSKRSNSIVIGTYPDDFGSCQ